VVPKDIHGIYFIVTRSSFFIIINNRYGKYKEGGEAAFLKFVPPTPFAWPKLESGPRPRAYFDIKIG